MGKIIIVLDTNILVSALLGSAGASGSILRGCFEKHYSPVVGNALFQEYESLIHRDHLFKNCVLGKQEREGFLDAFLSVSSWVTIYYGWRPNLKDEADNHLIELAVASGADYLITKNIKDFKNAELSFPNFRILKPEQFLDEVQ